MASVRVKDDGSSPIIGRGREPPFEQGEYYVFDAADEVAKNLNKMAPRGREELRTQSRREGKMSESVPSGPTVVISELSSSFWNCDCPYL
jgi:hypothetical protein